MKESTRGQSVKFYAIITESYQVLTGTPLLDLLGQRLGCTKERRRAEMEKAGWNI